MSDETFGNLVKETRLGMGFSQSKLAEKADVSRNYLSQIERGIATNLSLDVKSRLCTELGIALDGGVTDNLPKGLPEFSAKNNLPENDIRMLARLEYRGRKPESLEEWNLLYKVIKSVLSD